MEETALHTLDCVEYTQKDYRFTSDTNLRDTHTRVSFRLLSSEVRADVPVRGYMVYR